MDPRDIVREHLTLGERGSVLDCFCNLHAEQARKVMWEWLQAIEEEGRKKRAEHNARTLARIENWLEGVDPALGEGPAPQGEGERG